MKPLAILLLLTLQTSASDTITQKAATWCGEERHPRYTDHERIVCLASFYQGAYEGHRLALNITNTNDPIIRGDGDTCIVTVGKEVIECPEKEK